MIIKTLSKFIEELQEFHADHGDVPVWVLDRDDTPKPPEVILDMDNHAVISF
jgi:hypothetical protein